VKSCLFETGFEPWKSQRRAKRGDRLPLVQIPASPLASVATLRQSMDCPASPSLHSRESGHIRLFTIRSAQSGREHGSAGGQGRQDWLISDRSWPVSRPVKRRECGEKAPRASDSCGRCVYCRLNVTHRCKNDLGIDSS